MANSGSAAQFRHVGMRSIGHMTGTRGMLSTGIMAFNADLICPSRGSVMFSTMSIIQFSTCICKRMSCSECRPKCPPE